MCLVRLWNSDGDGGLVVDEAYEEWLSIRSGTGNDDG